MQHFGKWSDKPLLKKSSTLHVVNLYLVSVHPNDGDGVLRGPPHGREVVVHAGQFGGRGEGSDCVHGPGHQGRDVHQPQVHNRVIATRLWEMHHNVNK